MVESLRPFGPLLFLLLCASLALNCPFILSNKPSSHLLALWGSSGEKMSVERAGERWKQEVSLSTRAVERIWPGRTCNWEALATLVRH